MKFLHFESARQENKTSNMHENLIDYTQDILIHIYDIKFVSNCLILKNFFFNKVRYIPILSKIAYFRYRRDYAIIWPHPLSISQSEFCFAANYSWCPWWCTHMPQNMCAKKVTRPTKACATTTHEFSQFSHTLSILPPVQSNGGKNSSSKFCISDFRIEIYTQF